MDSRNLAGYIPRGHKESDTTRGLTLTFHNSIDAKSTIYQDHNKHMKKATTWHVINNLLKTTDVEKMSTVS